MLLLTQGKTNWKYILIVAVLATAVTGAILWFSTNWRVSFPISSIKEPDIIED